MNEDNYMHNHNLFEGNGNHEYIKIIHFFNTKIERNQYIAAFIIISHMGYVMLHVHSSVTNHPVNTFSMQIHINTGSRYSLTLNNKFNKRS